MKTKFHLNHVSLRLGLIAFTIAALITLILYVRMMPWELQQLTSYYDMINIFQDFNHDGLSEKFSVNNYGSKHNIIFYNHSNAIIDQLNIQEFLDYRYIFFGDYNGDEYDECFVFSTNRDSLFLYVFDIARRRNLLMRHFLMKLPYPHPFFKISDAVLYDLHNDYKKELLFLIHPGLASAPRGLYVFDLQKKKIVNRFENNASKLKLIIFDLNNDGKDEIVVLGKANGNGKKDVPFTDWKNWIFILDQDLNLIQTPSSFGSYPSAVRIRGIRIKGQPFLLLAHYQATQEYQDKPLGLYLVNGQGHFVKKHYLKINDVSDAIMAVDDPENVKRIFVTTKGNTLFCFDADFKLLHQNRTKFSNLNLLNLCDLDNDGNAELITSSTSGVQIFNQDLRLLASIKKIGKVFSLSIRYRGNDLTPEIGINGANKFYLFAVHVNHLFHFLPLFFILLFLFLLIILYFVNKLTNQLQIYFNYFTYSIKQTTNAIFLLRPDGRIFFFNQRLAILLSSQDSLSKNSLYHEALKDYPQITEFIKESMKSVHSRQQEIYINTSGKEFKGRILAVPFKSRFGRIIAWLIEIQDFTSSVLNDRYRTWSRTVRKMAHDIKTPLGSVLLNIERIQQKIQDTAPELIEITEQDFNMTLTEIKRIHEMTKHFLKFTNLEIPNTQPVFLNDIIRNTINHFKAYLGNGLEIETNLEQEPHTIQADPKQVEMVFQIFIENAIDALKGKGKILITSVLAQNLEENFQEYLEIEIADNGPGIPAARHDQIFEPFYTTKKEGTGMGLAIAKKIINDHNGEIELISKENFGTVFRITFPAKRETHESGFSN